jgi:hypothetical protein
MALISALAKAFRPMPRLTLSTSSTTAHVTSGIFSPSTAAERLKAERRCSARPVVGQWAAGARKPKSGGSVAVVDQFSGSAASCEHRRPQHPSTLGMSLHLGDLTGAPLPVFSYGCAACLFRPFLARNINPGIKYLTKGAGVRDISK